MTTLLDRKRLAAARVIAVIRAPSPEGAVAAAGAVVEGGLRAVEITHTTPQAPSAIEEVRRRHGDEVLVGAGTVLSAHQVPPAVAAGSEFVVSPGLEESVIAAARKADVLPIPGVLTPTEVLRALALGAEILKLFPASAGGIPLLRALRDPFPDTGFIPTGGIGAEEVGAWLDAGALAIGAAGALCPADEIAAARFDLISERAARFAAAAFDHG